MHAQVTALLDLSWETTILITNATKTATAAAHHGADLRSATSLPAD